MAKSKTAIVEIQTTPAQKSLNDLRKQINDTKVALYQLTEGSEEYNAKLQELGYAQDELTSFMAKTRQGATALEGSYNALSYQMGILKQQYKETNDEAQRDVLAKQINSINDKLKEMDEAVGNHSRNVGNYTKSMTEAFSKVGITIGNINPLFASLADSVMAAGEKGTTAFASLATGAKGLGNQLKALATNPVGAVIMAIVVAVKLAKGIFDKFKESVNRNETAQNNLKKAMAPIKAVVEGITNAFDSFVEVLTDVAAAIGGVVSQFMEFIGLADERVEAENKIADTEIANAELKRKYIVENSELELQASEARSKAAEKDKYTAQERIAFLEEYKEKQDQIAKNNLDMAQKELDLLQTQAAQGKNNAEMNDKIAEAQAKVNQAQQAYNDKLRETNGQIAELNLQIKAEQEAAKKAAQETAKKWADEIKKLREEYKSLIQTYDDATNGDNIAYKIQKLTQKQVEDEKKFTEEYKKGAITKKQYDQALYKSRNWLYIESQKLYQEEDKAREEAIIHYKSLVQDSTTTALDAIMRERDAEILALNDLGLSDEQIDAMSKKITEAYATKIQKAKNELYLKDVNDRMAIELAGDELIYQNREAMLKNDLSNRKMSLVEYIQQSIDLEIESIQTQISAEENKQAQLNTLYEDGKINRETYDQAVMASQTMVLDLQTQINDKIKEQNDILIDSYTNMISGVMDSMSGFISEMASIGDGISSQWANVFSTLSSGVVQLGESLKNGEKGWVAWGNVAASAISAASQMMLAMADEQDTTTKEGFETAKKYNIAAAVMSMLSGIAGAWASSMELMFPANVIVGSILSTLMTTVGALQISKIKQQTYGGSSSASGSSSVATPNTSALANIQAPVQWSSNVEGASTSENVKDTRVYVVESDITNSVNKVNIEESENRY